MAGADFSRRLTAAIKPLREIVESRSAAGDDGGTPPENPKLIEK
jgi:hypothetical protein